MVNSELLNQKISESGLKKNYISSRCGLSRYSFLAKMQGKRDFTGYEIGQLKKMLGLSAKETETLFFADASASKAQ